MKREAAHEGEEVGAPANDKVATKKRARKSASSSPTTGSPTSEREPNDVTVGESTLQSQTKASVCPMAPDGGYGWVIVASSFMTNVICDGLAFSFGILFPEIQRRYGTGKGVSATVGGLFMAMPLLAGPVASSLIERRDYRKITILGSVISFVGIFASVFAPTVTVLCFTFGFICGVGLSVCYTTAVVAVTHYFETRRGLATSIAISGGGVGSIVFPPFVRVLLEWYGWHGTWMMLSGITLHLCLCASLFRDLRFAPLAIKLAEVKLKLEQQIRRNKRLLARKQRKNLHMQKEKALTTGNDITKALNEGEHLSSTKELCLTTKKPTATKQKEKTVKRQKRHHVQKQKTGKKGPPAKTDDSFKGETLASGPSESIDRNVLATKKRDMRQPEVPQFYGRRYAADKLLLKPPKWYYRRKRKGTEAKYSALSINLHTLSQRLSGYLGTRLNLFRSLKFTEFMISNFLLFAFNDIFYVNLPEYVTMSLNISEKQGSWLVPITGVANTLSIPLFGALADCQKVNNSICYGLCTIVSGVCVLAIPFVRSYSGICGLCAVFGLFVSASASLTAVIVVELLSLEEFVGAFGALHLMQGIGNLVGTPFAGALYDWTGSYKATFFTGGCGLILSGVLAITSEMTPKRNMPNPALNYLSQKEIPQQARKQKKNPIATSDQGLVLHDAVPFDEESEPAHFKTPAELEIKLPCEIPLEWKEARTRQPNIEIVQNNSAKVAKAEASIGVSCEAVVKMDSCSSEDKTPDTAQRSSCELEVYNVLAKKGNRLRA